jgi:single-strand DNA-binding protein
VNNVILVGRLTKDPELRYTQTETAVCSFTLAVDRMKKDDGADFIRCIAFNRTAENISKFMSKGRQMAVQGSIRTGSYENRDGQRVYTTDVMVSRAEFVGSANQENRQPNHQNTRNYSERPNRSGQEKEEYPGFETIDEEFVPF